MDKYIRVAKLVRKMSEHELIASNQCIIARLKKIRKMKNNRALEDLEVGDMVSFDGRGVQTTGEIVKIGHKFLRVLDKQKNVRWRVPAFMTKKVAKEKTK